TQLRIPAIDFNAVDAGGKVVVEDGLVSLRGVTGKAYGGIVRTTADLDFRGPGSRLYFTGIEVENANVSELPESWGLPRNITGRLTGRASLEVVLEPGQMDPLAPAAAVGLVEADGAG